MRLAFDAPVATQNSIANFAGSLGVGFDVSPTGDPGSDDSRNHVSVHFDGELTQDVDLGTALDLAGGEWTHARIVVRPRGFSDVTVSLAGAVAHRSRSWIISPSADWLRTRVACISRRAPTPPLRDQVVADFDMRITPGAGRGDGIGFALLNTAIYGTSGPVAPSDVAEEPNFAGSVGIGFHVCHSSDPTEVSDNRVSVHFNGTQIAQLDVTPALDLAGGE
jgi:hypothetical protein